MKTVCLHGAECTGKTLLAGRLGYPWVREYGRTYCEQRGTELTIADLLAIAEGHVHETRAAQAVAAAPILVLDTDPLMTAAWSQMLFGHVPPVLFGYPKADLYLHFAPDVPWEADGTRFFGDDMSRARFSALAEEMLVRAEVPYVRIAGPWAAREALAREAIEGLLEGV